MRIIVAGSRSFTNRSLLFRKMDRLTRKLQKVIVLSGHAQGADRLGEDWALLRGWTIEVFHPMWEKFGKRAGLERNCEMVQAVGAKGVLVAFWNGKSTGTAHIIGEAKRAGIKTIVVGV